MLDGEGGVVVVVVWHAVSGVCICVSDDMVRRGPKGEMICEPGRRVPDTAERFRVFSQRRGRAAGVPCTRSVNGRPELDLGLPVLRAFWSPQLFLTHPPSNGRRERVTVDSTRGGLR